ncbi:type VI secretion system domain-containing protein, partial [Enterobacter hormaechei]
KRKAVAGMKIYRPLWEDGAFLAPQQFQQQARWDAHVADTVARMALANPWGVLCAEFDEGALALSRLNATRLCVRFADGTLVDTDLADNLPPVCDLSAAGSDAVEVLLCLPLLSANGGNLDDGQDSARPRRWQSERVTGLETLAFNDGTPFADEVTLNWIQQQVTDSGGGWQEDSAVTAATASGDNDILQLESEALTLADSDGPDVALSWLQNRPGITTARSRWLLRLLMARVAEQTGKNELALHLLGELDGCAAAITLTQWEPDLLFEVKARRLKLLRMKAGRNDTDKTRLNPEMEHLLAGLIAIDPARAAVLCA